MKEIMQGKRPEAPDWAKDNKDPEWLIKLKEEYLEGIKNIHNSTIGKWEKFIDNKIKEWR